MHAAPDMQIHPADNIDSVLETLECADDIPKDVKNWEKHFFNTQTSSSRRQNSTAQTQQIKIHATVKYSVLLPRLKDNLGVMNAIKKAESGSNSEKRAETPPKHA